MNSLKNQKEKTAKGKRNPKESIMNLKTQPNSRKASSKNRNQMKLKTS